MLSRWLRPRIAVDATILGVVGGRMVRYNRTVRLPAPADVAGVLAAAGAAAGVDLLAALRDGAEPAVMLDGTRIGLPEGLSEPVADGSSLSWLMPMAGG